MDEAIENAKEAIALWIETVLDAGQSMPKPGSVAACQKKRAFKSWVWASLEIDPALLSDVSLGGTVRLVERLLINAMRQTA